MTVINTSKQSFWTQKNNNAKYGFFPTVKKIVDDLEMSLIDFSNVSPDTPINISDFTAGEFDQLYWMHEHIARKGLNPISYGNEITKERYEEAKKKYENIPNFHLLNSDFFCMRCRSTAGGMLKKNNFAIIRNNPPYIWIERCGQNMRAEDLFFMDNAEYNIAGGIQIFELPLHQLIQIPGLMRKICYRYDNVNILRFPDGEYEKFDQVVVIGTRKVVNSNEIPLADAWIERLKVEDIQKLDEVNGPLYNLNDKILAAQREITLFRDGKVNDSTLTSGLWQVFDDLLNAESSATKLNVQVLKEKPIIEKLPGHIAQELASGRYNGLMGDVLVRGGSRKQIVTVKTSEPNADVTEEIEVIKPFVEITNNKGDIIFKES